MGPLLPLAIGAQAYSMYQQHKAGDKQEKYVKEQQAKADREARRAALGRAIGANENFMPRPEPGAPNVSGEATKSGIAQMLNYSLNDYMANPEKYAGLMNMLKTQAPGIVGGAAVDNMYAGMA